MATLASSTPHSPTSHPSQHRTERGPEPHTAHHLVVAVSALRLVEVRAVRTTRIPREAPSPSRLLPVELLLRPPPTTRLFFGGGRAVSFSDGRNDLPTAIRGPPPPRVAHSMPLGLPYLGTHMFSRRAAGLGTALPVLAGRRPPRRLESGVSCCISPPRYSPGKRSGEGIPCKV